MTDELPKSTSRAMRFANGTAVGTSDEWEHGQYCTILTKAGMVGCAIFDLAVAAEFGDAIAVIKGTPEKPLAEPEDLLDAKVTGISPKAESLGVRIGMTGREAVETLLAVDPDPPE